MYFQSPLLKPNEKARAACAGFHGNLRVMVVGD
jgi:hypothetical protein